MCPIYDLNPQQMQLVAVALLFLLQRGLLYTDLRAQNILTRGDEVFLIDYDDMQEISISADCDVARAKKAQAESREGAQIWAQVSLILTRHNGQLTT